MRNIAALYDIPEMRLDFFMSDNLIEPHEFFQFTHAVPSMSAARRAAPSFLFR